MQSTQFYPNFAEPWLEGLVGRLSPTGERVDTLLTFDWIPGNDLRGSGDFWPLGLVGSTEGAILVGQSNRPQIQWFDGNGVMTQIVRWQAERPLVTDSVWGVYEEGFLAGPGGNTESRLSFLKGLIPPIGEPLPHFGQLWGDNVGNVWVGDYSVDRRVTARIRGFSRDGTWLGSITLPPYLKILAIRHGRLLGVQFNELGVEAVVLYAILR